MKKIFNFAMIALLALGAASCSKSEELDGGNGQPTDGQRTVFTFKGVNNSITTKAIATDAENVVSTLDIFMFDTDGKLRGTFSPTPTVSNGVLQADLGILSTTTYGTGNKVFYFVANGASHASLGSLMTYNGSNTPTMEADFVELLTDQVSAAITGNLLFSGKTGAVAMSGNSTVELRRRVARFDIENKLPSDITINKVIVANYAKDGYLFTGNSGGAVTYATTNYEVTPTFVAESATKSVAAPAFYLYPTAIPSQTTLTLVATVGGVQDQLFYVTTETDILPNYRYKLIYDGQTKSFSITLADWNEADDELPVTGLGSLSISGLTLASGNGTLESAHNTYLVSSDNTTAQLTFTVKSSTSTGVTLTPEILLGTNPGITTNVSTATNITRALAGYENTVTINIPAYDGTSEFSVRYKIAEPTDAEPTYLTIRPRFVGEGALGTTPPTAGVDAMEGILAVNSLGQLNLDGDGKIVYFKWGSVIALGGDNSGISTFDATANIAWAPKEFDITSINGTGAEGWATIPYADDTNFANSFPLQNLASGLGDPCQLAVKGGSVGGHKMPSSTPYNDYDSSTAPISAWVDATLSPVSVGGRYNHNSSQFYPAAGYMLPGNGWIRFIDLGGYYWTSAHETSTISYILTFTTSDSATSYNGRLSRTMGAPIRCVAE